MSTPLEFLYYFRDLLRTRDIHFAITSGMACVYYGLQQNTKDSDWIIAPADLFKVRELLLEHERRVPPWRISYRPIFGAPLEAKWLAAGWTSHLAIWPSAGGLEEHLDFFGEPPRVALSNVVPDKMGFAEPDVVAWMKRTDRDRDWPIVDGLGHLLKAAGDSRAVLHIQSAPHLRAEWERLDASTRLSVASERPLLHLLDTEKDDDILQGLVSVERVVWETVNQERYRVFQREWKEFYRRWKEEEFWEWPASEPFSAQHERLVKAVDQYNLPVNPLGENEKCLAWERGIERAVLRTGRDEELVRRITPLQKRVLP